MVKLENTDYWLLKNSRGQYICDQGKIKQNSGKAITFDTKRTAVDYAKINRRRAFNPVEVIRITWIDSSRHPRTVVTSEEKMIVHRHTDES